MQKKSNNKTKIRTSSQRRVALIVIASLLLLAVTVVGLEISNTAHLLHHLPTPVSASQNTKGEPIIDAPKNSSNSTGAPGTATIPGDKTNRTGTSGLSLLDPSGNFVSAHKNVPVSSVLSSVCNTTPGANCVITFTKGNMTKSLPKKVADQSGAAFWDSWSLSDIGLTSGTWAVAAIATLDNNSKTVSDALELTVAP